MAFLRFHRDKRGYEHFYLVEPTTNRRGKVRPRVLYWFRTPPNVKVGRGPFDEDMRRELESQNPTVAFDWRKITETPIPSADVERWRERRRQEKAERAARAATSRAAAADVDDVEQAESLEAPAEPVPAESIEDSPFDAAADGSADEQTDETDSEDGEPDDDSERADVDAVGSPAAPQAAGQQPQAPGADAPRRRRRRRRGRGRGPQPQGPAGGS